MSATPEEMTAMRRALELAAAPDTPHGPNPRVGCVLLSPDGAPVAEGHHRGAGTAHAEADALHAAGRLARGTTAVVTLEPCNHHGRTGPCTEALIAAGVARVVFAQHDPDPLAAGGAQRLREAGVEVVDGVLTEEAVALNRQWNIAVGRGRPFITWKYAATLDGRSAAADGSSRWISSRAARADAHRLRARCDAVLAGTGTVAADDPHLTVRSPDGTLRPMQPLRVVMGLRDIPPGSRVLDAAATTLHLRTRDPHVALAELHRLGHRHLLLEGGPTLAAAFLRAGLIDEVVAYLAPTLLGAGPPAVGDLGITNIGQGLSLPLTSAVTLPGLDADDRPNLRLTLIPQPIPRPEGRP